MLATVSTERPRPATLRLEGADFERVCVRRTGVAVYRGDGVYLRIGHGLEQEVATHLQMIANGFPVAGIIKQGVYDGQTYLVEESLGARTLGDAFDAELEAAEAISAGSFAAFMDVVGRYAWAQAGMVRPPGTARDFEQLVGVDRTAAHLSDVGQDVRTAFETAARELDDLPATLTHPDFHAFNMCAGGVIDLEGTGWGVAGYDVITAVFDPGLFNWGTGGAPAPVWFSGSQIHSYLAMVDETFSAAGIAAEPSAYVDEFLLCRAISRCAQVHPQPDVWRGRQQELRAILGVFQGGGSVRRLLHDGGG